jgi:hypothetical protein
MSQRLLTREEAARMCSLSPSGFSRWVAIGKLPGPIPGTRRWDERALNRALDMLSGLSGADAAKSAYDRWKEARARRA